MKKIFALAAAVVLSAGVYAQSVQLKTLKDSLSYTLGVDLGEHLKNMQVELDPQFIAAAVKDVLEEHPERMSREDAHIFLSDYFTVRLPEINRQKAVAYLAEIERTNPNVHKTESGLLYEIVEPGGKRPENTNETVKVHYLGRLSDGTQFDSSYDRGETMELRLNQVIQGWQEGLMLVGKGGKIRLWIPPELGYGERASGPIPANEVLFFEIELLDVIRDIKE